MRRKHNIIPGRFVMATKFTLMTEVEFDRYLHETDFNRVVQVIQNHHTLEPSYARFTGNDHLALLKGMENYHVTERGFSQIAQNLTSFPDGRIALCRPLEKIPAGIKGANQRGICIEHLGNFDADKDRMTEEQRKTIVQMNALLCREFRISPTTDTIVYHHWYDLDTGVKTNGMGMTKSCPGTAFFGGNSVEDCNTHFIPLVTLSFAKLVPAAMVAPSLRSAIVKASSLNVRKGIGTGATLVKSLARGIQVQVYEEQEGWCRVHPVEPHWVYGNYLQ
jgi:hypothetical protein